MLTIAYSYPKQRWRSRSARYQAACQIADVGMVGGDVEVGKHRGLEKAVPALLGTARRPFGARLLFSDQRLEL